MIKFGPSGNSISFFEEGFSHAEQVPLWLKNRNLDCFEYSFGRGVSLLDEKAYSINDAFSKENIALSVHAPYYINFANEDGQKIQNSINYCLQSADKGGKMGAKRVVIHPACQGKSTREEAFSRTLDNFKRLAEAIYSNGFENMLFCPETMGKNAQIGTVEEIAEICKIDKIFLPAIDFGHLNCRMQGALKDEKDFSEILSFLISELGKERMNDFHVHFSKIEFSQKGEVRHLTFADEKYGPSFEPFADALIKLDLAPVIICESAGTQAEDASFMKKIYSEKKSLFRAEN